MLTVPQEIKDILHQDSGYKNIRIHFPNGERQDICNDLIVKDSVSFNESLCSQDTLKFGLCESPVFECETVGVGNVKDATIEVSCEIECLAAVSGAEWRTDLQKYVYSIPYGTFTINECKRQADMVHRRIVAYRSDLNRFANISWFENNYKTPWRSFTMTEYTPSIFLFLLDCLGLNPEGVGFFDEVLPTSITEEWTLEPQTIGYGSGSTSYSLAPKCEFMVWNFDNVSNSISELDNLFRLFVEQTPIDNELAALEDRMFAAGYHQWGNEGAKVRISNVYNAIVSYGNSDNYSVGRFDAEKFLSKCPFTFYGYNNGQQMTIKLLKKVSVEITIRGTSQVTYTDETASILTSATLKEYKLKTGNEYLKTDRFSFPLYWTYKYHDTEPHYAGTVGYPNYSSLSEFDVVEYFANRIELLGQFGRLNRFNEMDFINIKRQFGLNPSNTLYPGSTEYPEGVTGGELFPEDYQSCWYEDEYTLPYGAVYCKYKNTSNVDSEYTLYLTGYDADSDPYSYKVYSLEGNKVIDSTTWTQAQIEAICNQIADNIEGVTYMPVDFVGRGLPYVEAGDTFEILTRSNDSITTIVLNRTLSGEMTLTDSYKSV